MAMVALAASAALLKPIIEKLSGKLQKDLGIFWGLEKECKRMKNMLTTISTVLTDAEKKSITDELVRHWLLQLQDVAYDIDDLLDDYQIEAQRRSKNKTPLRAIQDVFSSDNPIKLRANMLKKLKLIAKRLGQIMDEKKNFELVEGSILMDEDSKVRETFSAVKESEVYGRNEDKERIINVLFHSKDDEIYVLPVVGMGGIGKTTLAQIICKDPEIIKHFDRIIWVHVSMNFELNKILRRMIECVSGKNCDVSCIEAMQTKLRTVISGIKFLLVLDDVWNEDEKKWEEFETILTCCTAGSKILATTRSERVARIMGKYDHYRVGPLEFQHCWELFKQRAFRHITDDRNANLVNIGKEIVVKCNGLPLAAKHLGNLAGSRKVDWTVIRDNEIWQLEECGGNIVPSLLVSYFYLPAHLKRCFAYCALFSKGFLFEKGYMILLWTSEGFIPKSMRPSANLCFDYLVSESFFEESEETISGTPLYTMHDLIHDLACYVAGDKFFLRSEHQNSQNRVSWRYSSVCLQDIIELKKLRTLLHSGYKDHGTKVDFILQLQRLRVLELNCSQIGELPHNIGNLKHLRYLNLSCNPLAILPNSVSTLLCLEVLDLSWCVQLNMLPSELGALENLEVLNLSHCFALKNLPMSLCCLTNLIVLDLDSCNRLVSVPKGVGKLTKLERLPFLTIGGEEGCTIGELGQLNLLSHDLQIIVKEEWGLHDAGRANLGLKKNLKSLRLKTMTRAFPMGCLELPQGLEDLCIKWDWQYLSSDLSFGLDLPSSLKTKDFPVKYTNLTNVELHCINECEYFPQFGQLPQLKLLHLSLQFSITKIKEQFSGSCGMYPVLEELNLSQINLIVLEEVMVETEATGKMFSCLKNARLKSCPFISVFPFLPKRIENLTIEGDCGKGILSIWSLQNLYQLRKLILISLPIKFNVFEGMRYLTKLEELKISSAEWFYLPPSLLNQHLPSLKSLEINEMKDLRSLEKETSVAEEDDESKRYQPPPIFAKLQNLVIQSCNSLRVLPDWLRSLDFLQSLELSDLPSLQRSPRGTEQLTSLQKLTITDCFELSNQYRLQLCKDGNIYYKREESSDSYEILHIPYIDVYPIEEVTKIEELAG